MVEGLKVVEGFRCLVLSLFFGWAHPSTPLWLIVLIGIGFVLERSFAIAQDDSAKRGLRLRSSFDLAQDKAPGGALSAEAAYEVFEKHGYEETDHGADACHDCCFEYI